MIARHANIVIDYARLYESTKRLSITDGLTKLYNHRFFQDALRREFTRSQRQKTPLSLALLDIDHFKNFNDTYGHQQGDIVLQELARTLRVQVRSLDVVARYGGEEFAVIMPDASLEVALRVAERLRAAVESLPGGGADRSVAGDDEPRGGRGPAREDRGSRRADRRRRPGAVSRQGAGPQPCCVPGAGVGESSVGRAQANRRIAPRGRGHHGGPAVERPSPSSSAPAGGSATT